jgi:hypothetical protein
MPQDKIFFRQRNPFSRIQHDVVDYELLVGVIIGLLQNRNVETAQADIRKVFAAIEFFDSNENIHGIIDYLFGEVR